MKKQGINYLKISIRQKNQDVITHLLVIKNLIYKITKDYYKNKYINHLQLLLTC